MTDTLVIGGRIADPRAASRVQENARVTLSEAEATTGYHVPGRSAAFIGKYCGAESICALTRAGFDFLRKSFGGCLTPRRLMILARKNEKELFHDDLSSLGLGQISAPEARAVVRGTETVALAGDHDAGHDTGRNCLMQGFVRVVRDSCGTVLTRAQVNGIRSGGGRWQVSTPDGAFSAASLANAARAAGHEVTVMAEVAPSGIVPCRRAIARIPAPDGHDPKGWRMFFGVGESCYAKPDAGALLDPPAEEDLVAPQDARAMDATPAGPGASRKIGSEPAMVDAPTPWRLR